MHVRPSTGWVRRFRLAHKSVYRCGLSGGSSKPDLPRKSEQTMKRLSVFLLGMTMFLGAAAQMTGVNPRQHSLTAVDKAYVVSVINKIRSNVVYEDPSHGFENPRVVYRVLLLPTGEVMSVDRVLSSGAPDFDIAVQKGIWRASPLPKRSDGDVEHALIIGYSLRHQSPAKTVAQ